MPNRDAIVRGVIQALSDATPFYVTRRDISSFYECIPLQPLRERLIQSAALSPNARRILTQFFDAHCGTNTCGLPRGVGLTAVLAELVMREYDEKVQDIDGVYRYFRFADDILIFSTAPSTNFESDLAAALPAGMNYNPTKNENVSAGSVEKVMVQRSLSYLGYRFRFNDGRTKDYRHVSVTIDPRKLDKMKTRVILSLRDFRASGNMQLLMSRLRFISGNYRVHRRGNAFKGANEFIRSGIYYNYHLCGDYKLYCTNDYDGSGLKEMDGFLHGILFGRSSEFKPTVCAKKHRFFAARLRRLSFYQAYKHRLTFRFTPAQVAEMKLAWQNA